MYLNFTNRSFEELIFDHGSKFGGIFLFFVISIMAVFGFVENMAILFLFQKIQRLNSLSNRPLIQSLALQGILQNAVCDMLIAYYALALRHNMEPNLLLCKLHQFLAYLIYPSCYWTIFGISFVRYCHCRGYNWYFRIKSNVIQLFSVAPWIVGTAMGLLGTVNIFQIHYDFRLRVCLWNPRYNLFSQVLAYLFAFFVPISMTFIFNFLLCARQPLIPLTGEQRKIIKAVTIVFLTTLLCNGPFVIVMILPNLILPNFCYSLITFLGCLNSSINSFVYGWQSQTFRKSLQLFFMGKSLGLINTSLQPIYRLTFASNRRKMR